MQPARKGKKKEGATEEAGAGNGLGKSSFDLGGGEGKKGRDRATHEYVAGKKPAVPDQPAVFLSRKRGKGYSIPSKRHRLS